MIKPEASGFYATTLPALLPRLGVDQLVLAGIAADICVQFTAADAHMREYPLWIPSDAVAGSSPEHARWALEVMGPQYEGGHSAHRGTVVARSVPQFDSQRRRVATAMARELSLNFEIGHLHHTENRLTFVPNATAVWALDDRKLI